MCKVSVIIPVYNVKLYLNEAINSILRQTYTNLEIIIIDDGSNDGSEEICVKYSQTDNRIRVFHQENRGLSAARNRGLDCMTGDAVMFLDSDDALRPDAIYKMLTAMIHEDADIVNCRFENYWTEGPMDVNKLLTNSTKKRTEKSTGIYSRTEALHAAVNGTISDNAWNKLYRSSLWGELRYPEGHVYEDIYILLDIIGKAQKVFIMDEALVMHRKRCMSITTSPCLKYLEDRCLAHAHHLEYIRNNIPDVFTREQLENTIRKRLRVVMNYVIDTASDNPEKSDMIKYLRNQMRNYAKEVNIKTSGPKFITLYYFVLYVPNILLEMYHIYRKVKNID